MQAIVAFICLAITFMVGYSASTAVHERDELKLAGQYEAQAKAAEKALIDQVSTLEAKHEAITTDLRDRYDRVRNTTKTVYVSKPAAGAEHCQQAAGSDELPDRVGRIEVPEREIIRLLEAADIQTQSLMACQAYIDIVKGKQ
jgi:vacuolar-type H+-ATPase subunit D/Vma8